MSQIPARRLALFGLKFSQETMSVTPQQAHGMLNRGHAHSVLSVNLQPRIRLISRGYSESHELAEAYHCHCAHERRGGACVFEVCILSFALFLWEGFVGGLFPLVLYPVTNLIHSFLSLT